MFIFISKVEIWAKKAQSKAMEAQNDCRRMVLII
jgi:hypothetical protein